MWIYDIFDNNNLIKQTLFVGANEHFFLKYFREGTLNATIIM